MLATSCWFQVHVSSRFDWVDICDVVLGLVGVFPLPARMVATLDAGALHHHPKGTFVLLS